MQRQLASFDNRSFFVISPLLAVLSGFGCQQREAKSPGAAATGAASAHVAPAAPAAPANPHAADEQAAHASADGWLALIDQKQYGQGWEAAARIFQSSVTKDKWVSAAESARDPLGELTSRKFHATAYKTSLPGAPPGPYVVVYYDTNFEEKASATESVTLMKTDGAWKVAGYFVQ